jgi:hypothetical protein
MSVGFKTAPCRSCKAPIIWARTAAGKLMPVDPEPTEGGNVELTASAGWPNWRAVVHPQPMLGVQLRMPHHATCPQGKERRK